MARSATNTSRLEPPTGSGNVHYDELRRGEHREDAPNPEKAHTATKRPVSTKHTPHNRHLLGLEREIRLRSSAQRKPWQSKPPEQWPPEQWPPAERIRLSLQKSRRSDDTAPPAERTSLESRQDPEAANSQVVDRSVDATTAHPDPRESREDDGTHQPGQKSAKASKPQPLANAASRDTRTDDALGQ